MWRLVGISVLGFLIWFFFFNLAYYKEQGFLVLCWSNYVMGLPDGT